MPNTRIFYKPSLSYVLETCISRAAKFKLIFIFGVLAMPISDFEF